MILLLIILSAIVTIVLIAILAVLLSKTEHIEVTDKAIELASVLPIQTITDNIIVNGNGDITVGYRMFLPEVFSLTEENSLLIKERLEGLFKMLPSGTIIHQQNFFYVNKYENKDYSTNPIQSENFKYFDGKDVLNSYTNLYITFSSSAKNCSVKKSSSNTSLLRKFNYPFKQPFKNIDSQIESLEPFLLNFENGLFSIEQFSIKRMSSLDLNNAVYDYVNLSYSSPVDDARNLFCNPLSVTKAGDLKIGNSYVALLSLTAEGEFLKATAIPNTGKSKSYGTTLELPENVTSKASMIYPIGLGLPFDHIVNLVIEVTDTDDTLTAISREKQSLNYISNFYRPAKEKQEEQDLFIDEVSRFDYKTSYTALNVIISDTDKSMLARKCSLAQQGFSFMNQSGCYIENAELLNLFFCNIPGNARSNYRGFINTTNQALCYFLQDSTYLSSLTGHMYEDRFGKPVKIDMWNYSKLNNKNKIVIGPSGSGKSFWLNNYILQSYELGNDVMIIDIGGSYRSMIDLNRGKYFDSTDQSKFSFNPFLCERDKNGKYLYIDESDPDAAEDLIKTIVAIVSYIWKKNEELTPSEAAILRKSIIAFYEYVNNSSINHSSERIFPNLIEYRRFLTLYSKQMKNFELQKFEVEELMLLLEPYTEGELSYLLNAKENVDIVNDRLIAFDMESASKKPYFPLVVIITLQMVVDKIKRRQGVKKELLIDEALDFLKDEKFGEFIAYLYRTFRKKEGAITIAAQNVLFLKGCPSPIKDSITINCDTKIILDHSQYRTEYPNLRDVLSLSEADTDMIDSLQRTDRWREFFLKMASDRFVFRNEVSPFAAVAFESKQSTVVRIKKLFEETGSTYTAINRFLEEKQNN